MGDPRAWNLIVLPDGEVWLNDRPDVRHGVGVCLGAGATLRASLEEARDELRAHLADIEARIAATDVTVVRDRRAIAAAMEDTVEDLTGEAGRA